MERYRLRTARASDAEAWLRDASRTTYLCDVRTSEEFRAGSIPGAVHAPGGQLIQATDQWVGVRNARIVLIDGGEMVRAPVVASWLAQLGCDVHVLEGGVKSGLRGTPAIPPPLPELAPISASELKKSLHAAACTVFDLGPSMSFRKAHVPGSRWSSRMRIAADAQGARTPVVLVSEHADVARLASIELLQTGVRDVRLLAGGLKAWTDAGLPVESSPQTPPDADCIDYLFFVHDRHAGNREAMRQYLAWETGLMAQLDEQDKASFRVGVPG